MKAHINLVIAAAASSLSALALGGIALGIAAFNFMKNKLKNLNILISSYEQNVRNSINILDYNTLPKPKHDHQSPLSMFSMKPSTSYNKNNQTRISVESLETIESSNESLHVNGHLYQSVTCPNPDRTVFFNNPVFRMPPRKSPLKGMHRSKLSKLAKQYTIDQMSKAPNTDDLPSPESFEMSKLLKK